MRQEMYNGPPHHPFNLATTPSGMASFYIALHPDYQGPHIAQSTASTSPQPGYFPAYSSRPDESDASIPARAFTEIFPDNRITFAGSCCTRGRTPSPQYAQSGYFAIRDV